MYAVGMDVGGTKTRCVCLDLEHYKIIARHSDEAANPASTPRDRVVAVVRRCVENVVKDIDVSKIVVVGIASAGVGRGYWREVFVEAIEPLGIPSDRIEVFEDYVAAHTACFLFEPGIMYIAGTGSSLYATDGEKTVKVGGWGHLLDDTGSAYQVGRDGIAYALRYYDGREEECHDLFEVMMKFFELEIPELIIPKIYGSDNPKQTIASFAPVVVDLARKGSTCAIRIIEFAIEEMTKTIVAAMKKLNRFDIDVAIVGGFYTGAKDLILPRLEAKLRSYGFRGRIVEQRIDTTCAAILVALKRRNLTTKEVVDRIATVCSI